MRVRRVLFLALLFSAGAMVTALSAQSGKSPCASPEARQFDFWVGEWAVTTGGQPAGRNRIQAIHNGCTLLEEYQAAGSAYEGKSFNYYDASDAKWHQVWVDNGGTRLHLSGAYADGKMVMSGERVVNGSSVADRITWHNNADGTVRQVWDQSSDGSKTWKTVFDGLYTRVAEATE